MVDAWLTAMSPNLAAVINPLTAACEEGFLPDELHVLENPGVREKFDDITSMMERVVIEYGGDDPELSITHLDEETDFGGIVEHFRKPIVRINEEGGTTAVDVTPGRKFMSVIAFQAGIKFEADHIYYGYVSDSYYYGRLYPAIPRPVVELIDFTEVF
jgi:hypothetical protein